MKDSSNEVADLFRRLVHSIGSKLANCILGVDFLSDRLAGGPTLPSRRNNL